MKNAKQVRVSRPCRQAQGTGRRLPVVAPRVERGRVYYTEYAWQEDHCGRQGPPWLNAGTRCRTRDAGRRCTSCSDYHHLGDVLDEAWRRGIERKDKDLPEPGGKETISAREALVLVRRYLPYLRTADLLFAATAWQPFKVVFEKGSVYYTDHGLVLWAKARAAGELAPWEEPATTPRVVRRVPIAARRSKSSR